MLKPPFVKWPELQISKSKMEKEMDEFIVKESKFTVFSFNVGQTESKGQTKYFTVKRSLIQRFCQSHDICFHRFLAIQQGCSRIHQSFSLKCFNKRFQSLSVTFGCFPFFGPPEVACILSSSVHENRQINRQTRKQSALLCLRRKESLSKIIENLCSPAQPSPPPN